MDLTQSTKAFSFKTCGVFLGLISETLAISSPSSAALAESAPTSSSASANCLLSLSLASLAASAISVNERVERLALVDSSVIPPAYLLMEVIKEAATDNEAKEPINQRVWLLLVSFLSL